MANEELFQLLQQLPQKEKERVAKEIVDTQIKIVSALYDKGVAYTNLIIIAGYASFFALWSFTKDYLSQRQVLWSAIIMSVSIITFVFFEVIKMVVMSKSLLARSKAMSDPSAENDPNKILANLREYDLQAQKVTIRLGKFWNCVLLLTVLTALIAIAILFYAFVSSLVATYA
jgi:hypothetical protein